MWPPLVFFELTFFLASQDSRRQSNYSYTKNLIMGVGFYDHT